MVQEGKNHLNQSGSMCGKLNNGFSIIELIVVIAIIALLGTVVVPNFQGKDPKKERQTFTAQLNDFMTFAWYNGITTGKIQRVVFDLNNHQVYLEQQKVREERPSQETTYERVNRGYTQTAIAWPKHFVIKNFIIEGFDEVGKYGSGGALKTTWFFIVPDGLAQDVIINIVDKSDQTQTRNGHPFSLILNPFSAQFKEYEQFQKIA